MTTTSLIPCHNISRGCQDAVTMKSNKPETVTDIPLGINAKGSLIELAHKLKWAHKHFNPQSDDRESDENDPPFSKLLKTPWLNGAADGGPLDPDRYVIKGMFCEGRPHPLLAYGEALFQNAMHGEPCNYTSLGTVHNYKGTTSDCRPNGLLPFSASSTMNESIQQLVSVRSQQIQPSVDVRDQIQTETIPADPADHAAQCREVSAESKYEALQTFLRDNPEIFSLIPKFNGVRGPSLWRLLTATKEVREVDIPHVMKSYEFKDEKEPGEIILSQPEHPHPANESLLAKKTRDLDIRDRMIAPLTDTEMSLITSSAVDFVVSSKLPSRVMCQIQAMQSRQKRTLEQQRKPQTTDEPQPSKEGCLRKYQCLECPYQTDNKSHYRRHTSSVHFIGMPYFCYICNKEFPRSEKVKAHFVKVHPDVIYDHRLVRKDKFFGVDYSPENSGTLKDNSKSPGCMTPKTGARNVVPVFPSTPDRRSSPVSQPPIWKSATKSEVGEKRFYCPECPYTGKDIWHLKRHFNDVHQQRKHLKCPQCDYSTGRKHRLVSHMKNHGELFCFHCDFSTSDLITFQSHVKICAMSQRKNQHQCLRCQRPCSNRKQLQDHLFKEHQVVMFCCEKCMFYTENGGEYESHLRQHEEQQKEEGYVCQVCNQVLSDYRALRQHLATHKQPGLASPPPVTPSNTPNRSNNSSPKKPRKELECPDCEFKTIEPKVLKEHKALHSPPKLSCDFPACTFTTSWPMSLEHHKKIQHLAVPSTSPEKLSPTKPQGKGMFMCPVCKDNRPPFRYKRSFDKHMQQHREDEERCPLCGQVYYFRASLKEHLRQVHQANVLEESSSSSSSSSEDSSDDSDDSSDEDEEDIPTAGMLVAMPTASPLPLVTMVRPSSQGAAMEAYGPGVVLHGSKAPFP